MYDSLLKNIDQGKYSCWVFLDLSKAFDTANHRILLQKLKTKFGIRGTPLKLFESFLSKRQQYLNFGGAISEFANVTCGIPRGSSLGPLLFLLYVKDLPTIANFDATPFADETQRWARSWSSRSDRDLEDQDRHVILIFKITFFVWSWSWKSRSLTFLNVA